MKTAKKVCRTCKRELDLEAFPLRKDSSDGHRNDCKDCNAKRNKKYRAENKEKVTADIKVWKEKHPGYDKEQGKKWRKMHPNYDKEKSTNWRTKHPNYDREKSKQYYQEHKEELNKHCKKYYQDNKEKVKQQNKKWKEEHPDYDHDHHVKWYTENKDKALEYQKKYRDENKETIKIKYSAWLKTPAGKEASTRHKQKRRSLGYAPLNKRFEGAEYHHLHVDLEGNPNKAIGLYIPSELHKSVPHNHSTMRGMKKMNELALDWWNQNKSRA